MHTVNLIPRNSPNTLTFVFNAYKAADDLYRKLNAALKTDDIIEIEDDFETKAVVRMEDIAAATFSEYDKDMDKNGDLQIIQQKSMLKTQNKDKNDIGLQMLTNQSQNGFQQ